MLQLAANIMTLNPHLPTSMVRVILSLAVTDDTSILATENPVISKGILTRLHRQLIIIACLVLN